MTGCEGTDPAALAIAGLTPAAVPPHLGAPPTDEENLALGRYARWIIDRLLEEFTAEEPRDPLELIAWLTQRHADIVATQVGSKRASVTTQLTQRSGGWAWIATWFPALVGCCREVRLCLIDGWLAARGGSTTSVRSSAVRLLRSSRPLAFGVWAQSRRRPRSCARG